MRLISLLTSLLFLWGISTAQVIPNGSFENWQSAGIHEKPVDWSTNQDTNHLRLEKDTLAIDGDYSLKLVPSALSAWTDCNSIASLEARIVGQLGDNKSLYFFIRSEDIDSTGYAFSRVYVQLWKDNKFQGEAEWMNFDAIQDFTRIEMPIPYPEADNIKLYLFGGATNGPADGCHDLSYTWIDQVYIDQSQTSSTEDIAEVGYTLFPNPARGILHIHGDLSDIVRWRIYNPLGQEINTGPMDGQPIPLIENGVLILKLVSKNGHSISHKILNSKTE